MPTLSFEAQSYFKRYKELLLPSVTLVLVVALTLLVLLPQIYRVVEDFKGLGKLKTKLGLLNEKAILLENLDVAELTIRTREVMLDLPVEEDLGYFVGSVRNTVEKSGVALEGVQLAATAEVQATASAEAASKLVSSGRTSELYIPLKINIGGSLVALRQLLTDLNVSAPVSEMQSFAFGRSAGDELFGGSVTVHYYYFPAPATIGLAEQPLAVVTASEESTYQQLAQLRKLELGAAGALPEVKTGQEEFIR